MRIIILALAAGLWAYAAQAQAPQVDITLTHNSPAEAATRAQLQRLIGAYDLSRWTFTHAVAIDERAIPHSHPVLTLHTRHLRDDDLLLSTYAHEQLHWWFATHQADTEAAIADLRKAYPQTPTGFPKGSDDETGNYVHLMVVFLEWQADKALLGELRARAAMEFWSHDHYTWIYRTVLDDPDPIRAIIQAHHLVPPPAAPASH